MTRSRGDLSKLFRSLAPEEDEPGAMEAVVTAAEQRWPLLQSAKPRIWAPPPELAPAEREAAWAPAPKPAPGKKRKRPLSVPRLDDTLALSLSKMSEHGGDGAIEKPRRRRRAPVATSAPLQTAVQRPAMRTPAVGSVEDRHERVQPVAAAVPAAPAWAPSVPVAEPVREAPRMPAMVRREPPAPAVAPVPAPAFAQPAAESRPQRPPLSPAAQPPAAAPAGGGADDSLKSVFKRLHERASPPAAPAAARPSFMSRLGKR